MNFATSNFATFDFSSSSILSAFSFCFRRRDLSNFPRRSSTSASIKVVSWLWFTRTTWHSGSELAHDSEHVSKHSKPFLIFWCTFSVLYWVQRTRQTAVPYGWTNHRHHFSVSCNIIWIFDCLIWHPQTVLLVLNSVLDRFVFLLYLHDC